MTQQRLITISWGRPASSTGTGYNIYLVAGAPANSTKTLLSFNNGLTNTTYTYTGVEGPQYEFEVRTTDGTNESDPLEIFYPNGKTLYTPTSITPTGAPMMIARDVSYLTKDEFITYSSGLKLTTSSPQYTSGEIDSVLQVASEQVNRYCHRHFNVQTIDEVYQGIRIGQDAPKLMTIPLNESPIQNVNSIWIQVLKWFINISLDYLQIFPEAGFIQITPFLGAQYLSGVPLPSAVLLEGLLGKMWTNYTAGYDVIPESIKRATAILATKIIGLQENPVSAQTVRFGREWSLQWDKDTDILLLEAKMLLDPYRVSVYRRP
jgi:hypothetical protein